MPLPPAHRTPRIEQLQAIVTATPSEKLFEFPVLQAADHQLIGAFIQMFNYMDLNLRRAIETFAEAGILQGDTAKKYPKIHSSRIANAVQDSVRVMDAAIEDIPETIRILEIIERRREVRSLLGHWAARRIPNEDALFLMSKNEADAMQVGGSYLHSGVMKSAILDLADIRGLIAQELMLFEPWLARKVSEWRKRYVGE